MFDSRVDRKKGCDLGQEYFTAVLGWLRGRGGDGWFPEKMDPEMSRGRYVTNDGSNGWGRVIEPDRFWGCPLSDVQAVGGNICDVGGGLRCGAGGAGC